MSEELTVKLLVRRGKKINILQDCFSEEFIVVILLFLFFKQQVKRNKYNVMKM